MKQRMLNGIVGKNITIGDIYMVQETGEERKFEMSAELEEELLDTVARYLKRLLKEK